MKINPIDSRGVNVIIQPSEERQKELESLMWDGIYIKLRTLEELQALFTPMEITWFGWLHGIYQFPTQELIDHIKIYLMTRGVNQDECIEIGAGGGHIGRHLGIRMTDSRLQDDPAIRSYYEASRQPVIKYSPEVEKIDANAAVIKYKPRVVIGCWVTEFPQLIWGVREPEMMEKIESYLYVGNKVSHRLKPILQGNDGNYFPWLVSRSLNQDENRIWIVKGG